MKGSDSEKQARKFVIIDSQAKPIEENASADSGNRLLAESGSSPSKAQRPKFSKKELSKNRIIHPGMKDQTVLNEFRSLRMSLQARMEKNNSIVLVSSVVRGGGSSFTAANLATAFTFERGFNALLVDCNISNPSLSKQLGVEADSGLYDFLAGEEDDLANLIYPTVIPRLNLIPSGVLDTEEENAIEFFTGARMKDFVNEVRDRYDDRVIILDSPPILDSADTKVLAGLSDYIIVALPFAGATPSRVSKTISEFGNNTITGFVMVN